MGFYQESNNSFGMVPMSHDGIVCVQLLHIHTYTAHFCDTKTQSLRDLEDS